MTISPQVPRAEFDIRNETVSPPLRPATMSVIIVNFRTPDLTVDAAVSALNEPEATEVIIVDNFSGDHSANLLEQRFEEEPRVTVIRAANNLGFGAGNNLGARVATGDFLFLLNSDATLHRGALRALINCRTNLATEAIIAPAIFAGTSTDLQYDAHGPFPTALRILLQTSKRYGASLSPDWVSGCSLMIDRALFSKLNGFDERIFMYFEDVLLCWRAHQLGAPVLRCLDGRVQHLGGRSYTSQRQLQSDYYGAQDVFLSLIDQPRVLRGMVRLVRAFVLAFRKLSKPALAS